MVQLPQLPKLTYAQFLKAGSDNGQAATLARLVYVKDTNEGLDNVGKKLGNTRNVCKKYYVYPGLIKLYEEGRLCGLLRELDVDRKDTDGPGLTAAEKLLMKVLLQSL